MNDNNKYKNTYQNSNNSILEKRLEICIKSDYYKNKIFNYVDIKISEKDLNLFQKHHNDYNYNGNKYMGIFSIYPLDQTGTIIFINSKSKELLGYEQSYLIGKSFYSFVHPNDVERISKYHDIVLNNNNKNLTITHRILTNFNSQLITNNEYNFICNKQNNNNNDNMKIYKWFTSYVERLDNIIIAYSKEIILEDI